MDLRTPYLVFVGDAKDALAAKTGQGVVDWRGEAVVGQLRLPRCRADLGVADMTIRQAVEAGAKTFLIGVVNPGGVLPTRWQGVIVEALEAGLDIASGLHESLEGIPAIVEAARRSDRRLIEARRPAEPYPVATGRKRTGKRLLTVGTDCSVGKKYAALAIERELIARNIAATSAPPGRPAS